MFEVLVGYRNMIFHEHPAAKEMLNRPGPYFFKDTRILDLG